MKIEAIKTIDRPDYKFSEATIKVEHDTDVRLVMPNGATIVIQWRVEAPSMDVCLPDNLCVTNWIGDDMQSAPVFTKDGYTAESHVREAKQLVISLHPEYLVEEGG